MILVLNKNLPEAEITGVVSEIERLGFAAQVVLNQPNPLVFVSGDVKVVPSHLFSNIAGVEKVMKLGPACPRVDNSEGKPVVVGNIKIGYGAKPVVIAGPCSVENEEMLLQTAHAVKVAGAVMLRGGAFKPRTSPYDFRGLGKQALEYLAQARRQTGLPVVSEVMSVEQLEIALDYVDVLQIGARNMYNYELLSAVGKTQLPVLLKRGMSATINDLLQAAEYIMLAGNSQVILCERGIRTFETYTRNTLDLSAVAALKTLTNLPVIVDPSHGTGRKDLIRSMSRAAIAAGADGLIIEVHPQPACAMSDAAQAITPVELEKIVTDTRKIYELFSDETALSKAPQLSLASTVS
ncbi:MAG: 3-deoxy-7-phosphoheptulonate synthase [Candidatus Obscuribacterales bacterium]|nr:3-deoxy-7-phosphoheptulonate synthase [Candidatus Obscuribacterales bacterium]